jgi:LmbE family N-acetylglucosaminyl deacetylase
MHPYQKFVSDYVQLATSGKSLPLGGFAPQQVNQPLLGAPVVLIFSPHPDDECIIGGLALRLMRESGMRVVNVAVTLGSNKDRRQDRLAELKNACAWIGFMLEETGLEKIVTGTRTSEPQVWNDAVKTIAGILLKYKPLAIFFPHELDWNNTHIGTHFLIMDALKSLQPDFKTTLIQTEFWGQMLSPNLLVELSPTDAADMVAALSFHVGEMQRNPYHLCLPAWLQDNVRHGAELVGGQGGAAPNFTFATLYRVRKWENGGIKSIFTGGRLLSAKDSPESIFK